MPNNSTLVSTEPALAAKDASAVNFSAGTTETRTFPIDPALPDGFQSMTALGGGASGESLFRWRLVNWSDDHVILEARIVFGSMILAAADSAGTFQQWANTQTSGADTSLTDRFMPAFSYVNPSATVDNWRNASIELRQVYSNNMGGDGAFVSLDYFQAKTTHEATIFASVGRATESHTVGIIGHGAGSPLRVKLEAVNTPTHRGGHRLEVRARSTESPRLLNVRLEQGSTLVQEWMSVPLEDSFGSHLLTVDLANAESITDYSDLYVELEAVAGSAGGLLSSDIVDDFEDGTLDSALWDTSVPGTSYWTERNGYVEAVGGVSSGAEDKGRQLRSHLVKFDSSHPLIIEAFDVVHLGFQWYPSSGSGTIIWEKYGSDLMASASGTGGFISQVATAPYDATSHRWWRVTVEGTNLRFWTSPDGEDWTLFGERAFADFGGGDPEGREGYVNVFANNSTVIAGTKFDNVGNYVGYSPPELAVSQLRLTVPSGVPAPSSLIVPVGTATEVGTASSIRSNHRVAVGQPSSTEDARPVTPAKGVAVGRATVTVASLPIQSAKTVHVGRATSVETARNIFAETASVQVAGVDKAFETNAARAVGRSRTKPVASAAATETPGAVVAERSYAVGQATEAAAADAVSTSKVVPVGRATESNVATNLGMPSAEPVGASSEGSTARAIASRKAVPVSTAVENETAGGITFAKLIVVGQASATDTAYPVTQRLPKFIVVGQANEADAATRLGGAPLMRVWDGTQFVEGVPMVYLDGAFVAALAVKTWDGAAWVEV